MQLIISINILLLLYSLDSIDYINSLDYIDSLDSIDTLDTIDSLDSIDSHPVLGTSMSIDSHAST